MIVSIKNILDCMFKYVFAMLLYSVLVFIIEKYRRNFVRRYLEVRELKGKLHR